MPTRYTLALLNGGIGERLGGERPKQLLPVGGIPMMLHALRAADQVPRIDRILLGYPAGYRSEVEHLVADDGIATPVTLVPGGDTRHASVGELVRLCRSEHIIVHETARPLVFAEDYRRLIDAEHENVSFMAEIPFTVAPVDPQRATVTGSLERARLRNVQLPQKFRTRVLADAHAWASRRGVVFTEDATLCAAAGADVHFIPGQDRNLKVTTPTDVAIAELLLARAAFPVVAGDQPWNSKWYDSPGVP